MKISNMTRFAVAVSFALASLTTHGCGSGGGGGGGGDNDQTQTPGTGNLADPKDPATCARLWNEYVANNPRGRALTYETSTNGYTSRYTDEVVESSDIQVTRRTTIQGNSEDTTTSRAEFLATCAQGIPGHSGNPGDPNAAPNVKIEEQRKESRTVRAGTFQTNYIRARMSGSSGDNGDDNDRGDTVSETWITADGSSILVFSRTVMTVNGTEFESTTELVDLKLSR